MCGPTPGTWARLPPRGSNPGSYVSTLGYRLAVRYRSQEIASRDQVIKSYALLRSTISLRSSAGKFRNGEDFVPPRLDWIILSDMVAEDMVVYVPKLSRELDRQMENKELG